MNSKEKRLDRLHLIILCITVGLMIAQIILIAFKSPLANGIVLYSIVIVLSMVLVVIAKKRKQKYHTIAYAFYAICCMICILMYILDNWIHL